MSLLQYRAVGSVATVAALAAALLLLACTSGDDARTITIYSGRSQNLIEPLLDQFAEQSGFDVRVRYGDSAELALLIEEEGDRSPADVFLSSSPGPVGFLAERDRLSELPERLLRITPSGPSRQWVAVTGRQRVLVYNAELIDPDELPASVMELAREPWLGRVALAPTNGSFQDFVTLMRLRVGDDATLDWLRALAEGGAPTRANNTAIVQAVARGELEMGLVNHYYNERLLAEDPSTPSVNYYFADGDIGAVTIATTASILRGANRELAEAFLEFLLSPQAQTYFATETLEYPLAEGAEASAAARPAGEIDIGSFDALGSSLRRTLELIREAGLEN